MFSARLRDERGLSMISMLVSLVAVALLAMLSLQMFVGAGSKATQSSTQQATKQAHDVEAKTLAQSAQTAMETYAASSGNGYAGATVSALNSIEPTLITSSTTEAYLASVSATSDAFTVVTTDPLSGSSFTLASNQGAVTQTCAPAGNGGCQANGSW
jgi:Tfp pilus assembly protein PilV